MNKLSDDAIRFCDADLNWLSFEDNNSKSESEDEFKSPVGNRSTFDSDDPDITKLL